MKRAIQIGVILCCFLLVNIIPISVTSTNVNRTIYVDDDNTSGPWDGTIEHPYQYIQDGIDNAVDDDNVYILNGTYYESINITKSINLIGESQDNTNICGTIDDIESIIIYENDVVISGFTITDAILFTSIMDNSSIKTPSNLTLKNNTLHCSMGIFLFNSKNVLIENNIITYDLALIESGNNSNNVIKKNDIRFDPSIIGLFIMNNIGVNNAKFIENNLYLKNRNIAIYHISEFLPIDFYIYNALKNKIIYNIISRWNLLIEYILKFESINNYHDISIFNSRWDGNYWDRAINFGPKVF
jgi:hypothetical protein